MQATPATLRPLWVVHTAHACVVCSVPQAGHIWINSMTRSPPYPSVFQKTSSAHPCNTTSSLAFLRMYADWRAERFRWASRALERYLWKWAAWKHSELSMIWRYTIHLETASVISAWGPPDGLSPQAQTVDSNVTSTPTFCPVNLYRRKQPWHHQSRQRAMAGWETPYLETTILGVLDRKRLATGKKINRLDQQTSELRKTPD